MVIVETRHCLVSATYFSGEICKDLQGIPDGFQPRKGHNFDNRGCNPRQGMPPRLSARRAGHRGNVNCKCMFY